MSRPKALEQQCKNWLLREQLPAAAEIKQFQQQFAALRLQEPKPLQMSILKETGPAKKSVLIYLLEDEGETARHLCLTLGTFGYQVEWFQSLAQLELALARQIPDALVLDIELPAETETGLHFINRLQLAHQVPLFVLTSHDDFAHYLQAVRSGALGYFVKPLNASSAGSQIATLAGGAGARCFSGLDCR